MNKKLTQNQRLALAALHHGKWRSAYDLQIHRGVLDSLVRKNLLERRGSGRLGSMWSPRTTIEYRLVLPQPDEEPK